MKRLFLALSFLLCGYTAAFAVCSGGFDGKNSTAAGCSEIGALGDIIYERDQTGRVLHKRNEEEIKQYLVKTVEERMSSRGVTMKDASGQPVVKMDKKKVSFDLFNQNGDKIFTYTVDLEQGVPENEKGIIDARAAYDSKKAERKAERKAQIENMQALADKIKAEEIDKKAAAKK